MATINVRLLDILTSDFKLSNEKAKLFAAAIEETVEQTRLNENLKLKSDFKDDLYNIELSLQRNIKDVEIKVEQSKSETLKWFIGSFITIALMILGLYVTLILKK